MSLSLVVGKRFVGKSIYVSEHYPDHEIFSNDLDSMSTADHLKRVLRLLKKGKHVVLDDTNGSQALRKYMIGKVHQYVGTATPCTCCVIRPSGGVVQRLWARRWCIAEGKQLARHEQVTSEEEEADNGFEYPSTQEGFTQVSTRFHPLIAYERPFVTQTLLVTGQAAFRYNGQRVVFVPEILRFIQCWMNTQPISLKRVIILVAHKREFCKALGLSPTDLKGQWFQEAVRGPVGGGQTVHKFPLYLFEYGIRIDHSQTTARDPITPSARLSLLMCLAYLHRIHKIDWSNSLYIGHQGLSGGVEGNYNQRIAKDMGLHFSTAQRIRNFVGDIRFSAVNFGLNWKNLLCGCIRDYTVNRPTFLKKIEFRGPVPSQPKRTATYTPATTSDHPLLQQLFLSGESTWTEKREVPFTWKDENVWEHYLHHVSLAVENHAKWKDLIRTYYHEASPLKSKSTHPPNKQADPTSIPEDQISVISDEEVETPKAVKAFKTSDIYRDDSVTLEKHDTLEEISYLRIGMNCHQILQHFGVKSFTRGFLYLKDNMILTDSVKMYRDPSSSTTHCNIISGACQSSTDPSSNMVYNVKVNMNEDNQVSSGECDCPVGTSNKAMGKCKHCTALLLHLWVKNHGQIGHKVLEELNNDINSKPVVECPSGTTNSSTTKIITNVAATAPGQNFIAANMKQGKYEDKFQQNKALRETNNPPAAFSGQHGGSSSGGVMNRIGSPQRTTSATLQHLKKQCKSPSTHHHQTTPNKRIHPHNSPNNTTTTTTTPSHPSPLLASTSTGGILGPNNCGGSVKRTLQFDESTTITGGDPPAAAGMTTGHNRTVINVLEDDDDEMQHEMLQAHMNRPQVQMSNGTFSFSTKTHCKGKHTPTAGAPHHNATSPAAGNEATSTSRDVGSSVPKDQQPRQQWLSAFVSDGDQHFGISHRIEAADPYHKKPKLRSASNESQDSVECVNVMRTTNQPNDPPEDLSHRQHAHPKSLENHNHHEQHKSSKASSSKTVLGAGSNSWHTTTEAGPHRRHQRPNSLMAVNSDDEEDDTEQFNDDTVEEEELIPADSDDDPHHEVTDHTPEHLHYNNNNSTSGGTVTLLPPPAVHMLEDSPTHYPQNDHVDSIQHSLSSTSDVLLKGSTTHQPEGALVTSLDDDDMKLFFGNTALKPTEDAMTDHVMSTAATAKLNAKIKALPFPTESVEKSFHKKKQPPPVKAVASPPCQKRERNIVSSSSDEDGPPPKRTYKKPVVSCFKQNTTEENKAGKGKKVVSLKSILRL